MIDSYTAHKAVVWIGVVVLTTLLCLIHNEVIGPRRTDSGGWGSLDLVQAIRRQGEGLPLVGDSHVPGPGGYRRHAGF